MFFYNWKNVPQFLGKNCQIVANYELNFSFKMLFLRVSRRKNPRFFPVGPFFCVVYEMFTEIQENSSALKNFWLRA